MSDNYKVNIVATSNKYEALPDGVLDSDEFDLEVDLSDAEGDSESGI